MNKIYDNRLTYADVLEAQVVKQAGEKMNSLFFYELERLKQNQYLLTADEKGISEAEEMFNIIPDRAAENLEFRRQRVIKRNTTKPPYTFRYLRMKLDELFGAGNYNLRRDLLNRTLYVESSVEDSGWYNEVSLTLNKLKPANLVYINNPYIHYNTIVTEIVQTAKRIWNYKLGVSWNLGQNPFATIKEGEIIKDRNIKSIQESYLNMLAQSSVDEIAKARINGTIEISDFTVREAAGTTGTVEYTINPDQAAEITRVELLNASGIVLTAASVYIPVTDPVQVKHKFTIKEGE